jgi:DNA-binding transcriptional MocR family regulator
VIDLLWNFPLLPGQQAQWQQYLERAMEQAAAAPVSWLRPTFRSVEAELRARAAKFLTMPVDRTWLTGGGHHGTLTALLASGLAGSTFACEGASYPGFLDQCRLTQTKVLGCAIDDEGLLPSALRKLCEQHAVRGLFTMPTVQNPMGFVTPLDRREEIVRIAREYDLTIIEDDAYGFMQPEAPPSYAQLAPERTFYVRGLSKSFAPATRTGFLVAPASAEASMVTALKVTSTGTDLLQNLASLMLCEDGTLTRIIEAKRVEGAARNRLAREILTAHHPAPGARAAWHLWLPLTASPQKLVDALARRDVMISSGEFCAASPEYGHGVRLALGGEMERERTLEGIRIVAAELTRAG